MDVKAANPAENLLFPVSVFDKHLLTIKEASDIHNIFAEKSGMAIIQQFRRPVLNRTEKDKTAYSETIFHLKDGL